MCNNDVIKGTDTYRIYLPLARAEIFPIYWRPLLCLSHSRSSYPFIRGARPNYTMKLLLGCGNCFTWNQLWTGACMQRYNNIIIKIITSSNLQDLLII